MLDCSPEAGDRDGAWDVAPMTTDAKPNDAVLELVDLLQSGTTGRRLLAELMVRFDKISRFDCFLAIAMASALWEADLIVAQAEPPDGRMIFEDEPEASQIPHRAPLREVRSTDTDSHSASTD